MNTHSIPPPGARQRPTAHVEQLVALRRGRAGATYAQLRRGSAHLPRNGFLLALITTWWFAVNVALSVRPTPAALTRPAPLAAAWYNARLL